MPASVQADVLSHDGPGLLSPHVHGRLQSNPNWGLTYPGAQYWLKLTKGPDHT